MLLQLIYLIQQWDVHCLGCAKCNEYNAAFEPLPPKPNGDGPLGPCAIGKALLLHMLRCLQQGL